VKTISGLEFRHFSTSDPGEQVFINERCFDLWERVWSDTFVELNVPHKKVSSDDYLSKELGGLFYGDQPVGFLLYHFCDLKRRSHQKMSYFSNYPEKLHQEVSSWAEEVMVITYMTLEPGWRKSFTDLPISELLIGFAVLRLMESRASRMIGYFRNNRGTHQIFYRHGGIPLLTGQQAYNVEVDFAQITRDSATLSRLPSCAEMTLAKWRQFKLKQQGENHERSNEFEGNEAIGGEFSGNALDKLGIL
jgi:hypothetical protein